MDMEERHIVTIDLGTSKTALTVAGINGDNIQILYYKKVPSHGMKYSYVLNSGKESDVVRSLVEDAENELKIKIKRVIVGMPRYNVRQEAKSGSIECNREECITTEEIENLKSLALEQYPLQHPDTEEVFGIVPQSFSNGDEIGLTENDMIGVSSNILEGNFKIFIGKRQHLHNIDMIFKDLNIDVLKKYFTPDTTAKVVLTPGEMENGVALIDLGAAVTSVTIYYQNIMRHYAAIPFGGRSVTSDIKTECLISTELAENIKKAFGGCMPDRLQNLSEKTLHIKGNPMSHDTQIQVKFLSEIITARMKEIIDAILFEIQESGFADNLRSGVVITGGGANLMNCAAYIKDISGYDVRTGTPIRHLFSSSGNDGICNVDASVSAGLVTAAKHDRMPDCTIGIDSQVNIPEIEIEKPGRDEEVRTPDEDYTDTVFEQSQEQPEQTHGGAGKRQGGKDSKEPKPKKKKTITWIGTLFKEVYDSLDKENV